MAIALLPIVRIVSTFYRLRRFEMHGNEHCTKVQDQIGI